MANFEADDKLQQALTALAETTAKAPLAEDDEAGSAGTATGGAGGVVIDKVLFAEVFGLQRASEKQFGPVGEFDPIAYAAEIQKQAQEAKAQAKGSLKSHPILAKLAKFDGDTPDMNMNPQDNPKAQERNELRMSLRMGLKQAPGSIPKPTPGGR